MGTKTNPALSSVTPGTKQTAAAVRKQRDRQRGPLPELTHENLAIGVRTLVTMAACWELRDPTTTQLDKLQEARLRRILRELAEGAEMQKDAAAQVIATLMHDELAVAFDPSIQEQTWDEVAVEVEPGVTLKRRRPRGNEILSRKRRSKSLPRALMPFGDFLGFRSVQGDALASALLRCHETFIWLFQYNDAKLSEARAVVLADAIRAHKATFNMGVQEAVSLALGMFVSEADPPGDDEGEQLARKRHTYNNRWLATVRHPDRPDLLPENVDTGRYFGARDQLEAAPGQAPIALPLATRVAELIADALAAARPTVVRLAPKPRGWVPLPEAPAAHARTLARARALEVTHLVPTLVALERSRFPGLLDPVSRGASSPRSGDGLNRLLERLLPLLRETKSKNDGKGSRGDSIT